MFDLIQLPTEEFKANRIEIHPERHELHHFMPKPCAPYEYGIINPPKGNDFNCEARLVTE